MNKTRLLKQQIHTHKNEQKKQWWENYIKHDTHFLGVGIAVVRNELNNWYKQENIEELPLDEQLKIALSLFDNKYAEEKIAGILFLEFYLIEKMTWQKLLKNFEYLFTAKLIYDWNICDWFCVKVLGEMIGQNGLECAEEISKWHGAKYIWQARCSVVAFANLHNKSDYQNLILQSSQKLIKRKERFAKTAVGWIMREFSKIDKKLVFDFLQDNHMFLTREVITNSLKYDRDLQKSLLQRLQQ